MQTFFYARVSTGQQTTENQALDVQRAGFAIDLSYEDQISGKVPAADRPGFARMLDTIARTNPPKRLIVTKLDRLGRDAADIHATVNRLSDLGCGVKVLQLGDVDLTSGAGKIILGTLAAVAEVERDMIVERTMAGLERAKNQGKRLGRPKATTPEMEADILKALRQGDSVAKVARQFGVSRPTVDRVAQAQA